MKFAAVAVIVFLLHSCYADLSPELIDDWQLFKATYGKSYASDTITDFRFMIFTDTRMKVEQHNEKYERGEETFKIAVNQFADLLRSEFEEKMLMDLYPSEEEEVNDLREQPPKEPEGEKENMIDEKHLEELLRAEVPDEVDWRQRDAVTPVKNQGLCGSGWAFSAIGSLEGQKFLKSKELVGLSEQNLLDCAKEYDTKGCTGGWPSRAYDYIRVNGGIDTEESYPYEAADTKCRYWSWYSGATVTGKVKLPEGNEEALKNAVATVGPVSVLLGFRGIDYIYYSEGIYSKPDCDNSTLNHAALVVGYGTENGQDYWLLKNSWGTTWGEEGYMRLARNKNMCGVASNTVYPTV